jgi:hypothetical protein
VTKNKRRNAILSQLKATISASRRYRHYFPAQIVIALAFATANCASFAGPTGSAAAFISPGQRFRRAKDLTIKAEIGAA